MKTVVCLMGPTASGKTQLAIELVKRLPFDIISVDSAMVYRGMDIGTAKPDATLLKIAPHRLLDIRDPRDAYSAAQFRVDALREIQDIFAKGKIPLLVGGTMMYFRALQQGIAEMPESDATLRAQLYAAGETQGWPALHAQLEVIDPLAAKRIHPHDKQRIQRALEVYQLSGKNLTEWQQDTFSEELHFMNLAIAPDDRGILHARIAKRFSEMLDQGFMKEVQQLFEREDLSLDTPAIRSVGYRQAWLYLQGEISWDEMREKAVIATRQLAKRQLTWLRSWPELVWFDSEAEDLVAKVLDYVSHCVK